MRYMILVKATPATTAGEMPDEALLAEMADYHVQLAQAGILLDGHGLQPSTQGWRVHHRQGERTLVEGPFAGATERIAGYTVIEVRSREEALAWTQRFPAPHGPQFDTHIEVHQMAELHDLASREAITRFREQDARTA